MGLHSRKGNPGKLIGGNADGDRVSHKLAAEEVVRWKYTEPAPIVFLLSLHSKRPVQHPSSIKFAVQSDV